LEIGDVVVHDAKCGGGGGGACPEFLCQPCVTGNMT